MRLFALCISASVGKCVKKEEELRDRKNLPLSGMGYNQPSGSNVVSIFW